jgi:hypothetical protein
MVLIGDLTVANAVYWLWWSTICKALLQLFSTVQSKLATLLILLYSNSNALHKNYEGKHLFCAVCEKVTKKKKKKKIPDNMYI